ncbi:MAG TPA: hypothetical protein VD962_06680, partial [Rubricoccaceae bacterium]|nr:hypothetical protein [Rubricoccaceae bacterium]
DAFVRRWGPRVYAANVLFPVGICLVFGAPLAGLFGLAGLSVPMALLKIRSGARRREVVPA